MVIRQYWIASVIFMCVLISLFEACKKSPTAPSDDRPLINAQEYGNLNLKMTNYDVVEITHKAGLDLRSSNIVRIAVGAESGTGFKPLLSSESTYDLTIHNYIIRFDFTVMMDSSKITEPITIRYYSADSTYSEFDTTIFLYKYPYSSAEIFADSFNLGINPFLIDGISLYGSTFYFHPLDDGLYAYDLTNRKCGIRWNGYYRGSHIAADSDFVFCDINHQQIARYNLTANTAAVPIPDLGDINSIDGMAADNHSLYVLVFGLSSEYLKKFTLDGVLLDSIPYPSGNSYFMAIYDSIIYSKDESTVSNPDGVQISRFDLRTKSFLSNVVSPAKQLEPITIYGGQLYYCSFSKNFIGVMPVSNLVPVQTNSTQAARSRNYSRVRN